MRAEDRRAPIASSAAQVIGRSGAQGRRPRTQQLQSRVAAQIAAQAKPGEDGPVVLNTRGYNYQAASDLDRIAGDLERLNIER